MKIKLSAANNTMAPCWYALKELGYSVSNEIENGQEYWFAENKDHQLMATDPCMLLGLVKLLEIRGNSWQISDEKIDEFMQKYGG